MCPQDVRRGRVRSQRQLGRQPGIGGQPQGAGRRRDGHIREGAVVGVLLERLPGVLLRLGHVGLVEGVDTQDRAGDGGRDLPAEELATDPAAIGEGDVDDRVASGRERVQRGVERRRMAGPPKAHEDAVRTVDLGRA